MYTHQGAITGGWLALIEHCDYNKVSLYCPAHIDCSIPHQYCQLHHLLEGQLMVVLKLAVLGIHGGQLCTRTCLLALSKSS